MRWAEAATTRTSAARLLAKLPGRPCMSPVTYSAAEWTEAEGVGRGHESGAPRTTPAHRRGGRGSTPIDHEGRPVVAEDHYGRLDAAVGPLNISAGPK